MRATKGYVAGVGTTSALIGAIGCAFAVMSAVVAVNGWPLRLSAPEVRTVEGRAPTEAAVSLRPGAAFAGRTGTTSTRLRRGGRPRTGRAGASVGPIASAYGRHADGVAPSRGGAGVPRGSRGPAAGAASPAPTGGPGPVAGSGGGGGSATPVPGESPGPSNGAGAEPSLGGAVTQVTSGTGTALAQTGQQLGGAVQGASAQLGSAVGQVSPAAGQAVTQTGQIAGGVVSGTTGTAGQVVAGTGAAVGGLLGGLAGGGRHR